MTARLNRAQFLKDVFACALASYGGPEAHYGIFTKELIEKNEYVSQEELTELIGIFSLLPGPSSTQTITAIGYRLGGPRLALATLAIWIGPALVIMSLLGLGLDWISQDKDWQSMLTYLPAAAVAFIFYAAIQLTRKVVQTRENWLIYLAFTLLAFLTLDLSAWMVLVLLLAGVFVGLFPILGKVGRELQDIRSQVKPNWHLIGLLLLLALVLEGLSRFLGGQFSLFASIYRFGYTVIGGGQIMIPMMIQDLVNQQAFLSQGDFLAGYTLDQAVPGPLFSFAAFVATRSLSASPLWALIWGILGGALIFLPGTLLVFFATPLWQEYRKLHYVPFFLKGVSLAVAAIISYTALSQISILGWALDKWLVFLLTTGLLLSKKIPTPLIVALVLLAGLLLA